MRPFIRLAFVCVAGLTAGTLPAQDKFDASARAKVIAPYVDAQTIGVGRVDLTKVDVKALFTQVAEIGRIGKEELVAPQTAATHLLDSLKKAGAKEIFVVVNLSDLPFNSPFLIVPLTEGADARAIAGLLCSGDASGPDRRDPKQRGPSPFDTCIKFNNAVLAGTAAVVERVRTMTAVPRPELLKAFEAAGDTTAQLLLLPTDDNRRVIAELLPRLPAEIGGGESTVLSRGVMWAALGAGIAPQLSLKLVVQSQDAAAAKDLQNLITKGYQWVAQEPEARKVLPKLEEIIKVLTPTVIGDKLVLSVTESSGAATLLAALVVPVEEARNAAQRAQSMNNLKQLMLAMHVFHDRYNRFPAAASYDVKGKPLLSWRVHVLPYLDQEALYKEFHLDEPWDSEHNKKLIDRMPAIYRSPASKTKRPGLTTYLVPVGESTIFSGREGIRTRDIKDGVSNTVMLVDADDGHAVVWTKPDDWPFDPENPIKGLVGHHADIFLAAFADGSIQAIKQNTPKKTFQAMFTRNGGEVYTLP